MGDITDPRLIYFKGFLFLLAGCMAAAALLLEHPGLKVAFLLGMAVWCFARFYYFAFYVIQHYVDPGYRFAGLGSFALYLLRRRGPPPAPAPAERVHRRKVLVCRRSTRTKTSAASTRSEPPRRRPAQ